MLYHTSRNTKLKRYCAIMYGFCVETSTVLVEATISTSPPPPFRRPMPPAQGHQRHARAALGRRRSMAAQKKIAGNASCKGQKIGKQRHAKKLRKNTCGMRWNDVNQLISQDRKRIDPCWLVLRVFTTDIVFLCIHLFC